MARNQPDRNDQGANREDGNAPGTWPGSGTTVQGPSESATSGILADAVHAVHAVHREHGEHGDQAGSASTSASVQEPDDRRAGRSDSEQ
ncbi:MAG TPA: hypothetical protein VLR26_10545 [Frankiaceae bacterium]|nr:hypothetical protein [Frankiaceae bacterium]